MAAAAAIILDRMFGSSSYAADPGAVELLLSAQVPDIDRARSARLLGLAEARAVRAIAFVCADSQPDATSQAVETFTSQIRAEGDTVQLAKVGDVFAAITTARVLPTALPPTIRAGVGPSDDLLNVPSSWASARFALRFTVSLPGLKRPPVAFVEDLGPLMALANFPLDELSAIPDVEAIGKIAANDPSGEHIHTLDAFCHAGSLRRTATELYLHHTSVAARLAHISSDLGFAVDTPDGAFRARLALTLWHLSHTLDFDRQMVGR